MFQSSTSQSKSQVTGFRHPHRRHAFVFVRSSCSLVRAHIVTACVTSQRARARLIQDHTAKDSTESKAKAASVAGEQVHLTIALMQARGATLASENQSQPIERMARYEQITITWSTDLIYEIVRIGNRLKRSQGWFRWQSLNTIDTREARSPVAWFECDPIECTRAVPCLWYSDSRTLHTQRTIPPEGDAHHRAEVGQ
jgi:hypothetical protein